MTSAGSGAAEVSLTLDDGSSYPLTGKLEFTDVTVDQTTGAVTLRALFPNPKGVVLPGMYVRAAVKQGSLPAAILAPQQGVTRDQTGAPIATVVDEKGLAQVRRLKTMGTYGDQWIIADGLKPGDRMIVEGLQKVKPGQPVHPTLITLSHVPATAP
jgi:membrane fusion protein (multidrug efflux system)